MFIYKAVNLLIINSDILIEPGHSISCKIAFAHKEDLN